jgi:hypothetical protein
MFGEFRTRIHLAVSVGELMVLLLRHLSRESTKDHVTLVMIGNIPSSYINTIPPHY